VGLLREEGRRRCKNARNRLDVSEAADDKGKMKIRLPGGGKRRKLHVNGHGSLEGGYRSSDVRKRETIEENSDVTAQTGETIHRMEKKKSQARTD